MLLVWDEFTLYRIGTRDAWLALRLIPHARGGIARGSRGLRLVRDGGVVASSRDGGLAPLRYGRQMPGSCLKNGSATLGADVNLLQVIQRRWLHQDERLDVLVLVGVNPPLRSASLPLQKASERHSRIAPVRFRSLAMAKHSESLYVGPGNPHRR